jgi:hypothetical protein
MPRRGAERIVKPASLNTERPIWSPMETFLARSVLEGLGLGQVQEDAWLPLFNKGAGADGYRGKSPRVFVARDAEEDWRSSATLAEIEPRGAGNDRDDALYAGQGAQGRLDFVVALEGGGVAYSPTIGTSLPKRLKASSALALTEKSPVKLLDE